MEQEFTFQEYASFNNKTLDCDACKKSNEKKHFNYCEKCKKYICGDCIKKHIQKEYNIKDENYKLYKHRYNLSSFFCNIHNEICHAYCFDCEGNICPRCEIESHIKCETKVFNHNEILDLIKEQRQNIISEKKNFEKLKDIIDDCFESLKQYFVNLCINKRKEFEIKEEIINQLEFFKYDNTLIENVRNLEFENYDIIYDKNDSVDKKLSNIYEFFKKPKKMKKFNLCKKENLRGPYDFLQKINLKEENHDILREHLTDICFLNNYMDKNYFAASFNNGLLKIYDDNFEKRIPITIIKEFEACESINSLEKSADNSLLLVNIIKIKKIKFSDNFKEYKVIYAIEKKEQFFYIATEIEGINALLTTNDCNQIIIYDFNNGKELYNDNFKEEILSMDKISKNKIILQISKNNLMNSMDLDLEKNTLFINTENIESLNESINNEINIKKKDKDINLKIYEFEIVNNEIILKKNYSFEIGINYLGKIDEKFILLYDKFENKIILFDINAYENVLKSFFNSSLEPIASLVMNTSIDSLNLLMLFEGETLGQFVLNSKLKQINLMSKLKIENIGKTKDIKPNEKNKQKRKGEIIKIIGLAKDNFLIIANDSLVYNLKSNY